MEKRKIVKTKFSDPYILNDKGSVRTNLPHLRWDKSQSGVYLIKCKATGKIVYVGFSTGCLYKTVYRHFQEWIDKSRHIKIRYTYPKFGYSVRVIYTTPMRAWKLEKYLISKMQPVDNAIKYAAYLTESQIESSIECLAEAEVYSGPPENFPF